MKVSSSGSTGWTTLVGGSGDDVISSSATDYEGNLIAGGAISDNGGDGLLCKLNGSTGAVIWTQEIGVAAGSEIIYSVATDGWGDVYVVGSASGGDLFGAGLGGDDVFFAKCDGDTGDVLWGLRIGTSSSDGAYGVDTDLVGNVYIAGYTNGVLGDANLGSYDAFVAKYHGDNGQLLPGDANGDGSVDISDLTVLSQNWEDYSEVKTWAQGDFNGSGYVDIGDLTLLSHYWGLSTSSFEEALASIGTVPEPTTFAMLIAGLVGLVAYAWRKR